VINSIPLAINQGFLGFRCGKKLDARFLYYWFRANGPYLDAVANGSTYPELYVGDLFEFEIAVPLLHEQEQIVSILSALDDKIESNRRMNATLDATAQANGEVPFLRRAEMRESGVRDVLIYCRDHRCSHHVETNADGWPDDVRLSDIEPNFICTACGKRGAEVRPKSSQARMGPVKSRPSKYVNR
jgi:hypothetical protein